MATLQFSPEAKNDLHDIKEYITVELDSPNAAISTIAKITKSIRTLASFPDRGIPLSSKVDIPNDYRFLVCGNYLAFYRHEGGIVNVIRILYGKRDYISILFGNIQEDTPE